MATPTAPPDHDVMVGSVVSAEHTIDLDDVDVHTTSRTLRAPWWAIVLGVQLLAGDRLVEVVLAIIQ